MNLATTLTLAASLIAVTGAAQASTFTFTTLDNAADPTFNQLLGINNSGTISGYFGSGAPGHPNQGYTIAAPYTAFVPDNLPGSVQTQATGINKAAATTGFWSPTNTGGDANFGFIRWANHNGFTYLSVNNPLVSSTPAVNQLLGMNTHKIAAGFYNDANGNSHGYTYTVAGGVFTPVTIPGAVSSAATGINDRDLISGFFTNAEGKTIGFLKPMTGGAGVRFGVPHSSFTQLLGVNNGGMAVGFYVDKNQITHGLLYNPANGQWQTVDDPNGVGGTVVNGLNDKNQLVGFYTDAAGNTHGMLVNVMQ